MCVAWMLDSKRGCTQLNMAEVVSSVYGTAICSTQVGKCPGSMVYRQPECCSHLQVGSKKTHLHAVALKVFNMSIQYQICLEPDWIPRKQTRGQTCLA